MIEIYINSNGAVARDVFNALATFINASTFGSAIFIASASSIITAVFAYLKNHDVMILAKWFALYFIITVILIAPKVDVEIVDTSNPMANYTVDNVPYGIAAPAGLISSISHALTQAAEDIFHMPDDLSYLKTGILFGSKIFQLSTTVGLQDDQTKHLFDQYVQNCVIPDIAIHKYSWNDLSNTPDIWSFLANQNQSPLRGVMTDGVFTTCKAVLPILQHKVSDDVSNHTLKIFSTRIFGGDAAKAELQMQSVLQNSYEYFNGISQTAQQILLQNISINALQNSIQNYASYTGATGALQNYSDAKQMNNLTLANFNASNQAFYMLPLMQTMLFLLICSLFPLVVLLSLQMGFGLIAIRSYVYSIIYVSSWPILFVILNFMMNSSLYFATAGMAAHGITLSNANPLAVEHLRFAGYAGYMILAIPIITLWITKGLAQGMSQAAQYIGGMAHSIAGQVAGEAASGNISLSNTSLNNQSYNNVSANKHDTNATDFQGMKTSQLKNGGTVTTSSSGETFYQTSGAVSQLPIALDLSQGLSSSLSKSADRYKQQAMQNQTSFNDSISHSAGHLEQFSKNLNKQTLEGMGYSESDSSQIQNAMHHMNQIADDVSKRTGMSHQSSWQYLTSLAGNISIPLKMLGLDASHKESYYAENGHSNSKDILVTSKEADDFNSSLNTLKSFTRNHHIDSSHSESSNYLSQAMSELRSAETAAKNFSFDEQQATRYSEAASRVRQQGAGIHANLMPAFQEYVIHQLGAYSADALFKNSITPANIDRLNSMASSFINSIQPKYVSSADSAIVNPGFSNYADKSNDIYDRSIQKIKDAQQSSSVDINKQKAGMQQPIREHELKDKMNHELKFSSAVLENENRRLDSGYKENKAKITEEINK